MNYKNWSLSIPVALLALSSESFAQRLVFSFSTQITPTVATDGFGRYRPELDVSTVGANNFLVLCYRQWRDGSVVRFNSPGNFTDTNYLQVPNGGMYIFRINNPNATSSNSANMSLVWSNVTGHSHYAGGVVTSSSKVWYYYATPRLVTNVFTNFWAGPNESQLLRRETNVLIDQWGSSVSGMLTLPTSGTRVSDLKDPGSATPGFIVEGGTGAQSSSLSYVVIAKTKNRKVAFDIYRVP
jgi:hypothetical protein